MANDPKGSSGTDPNSGGDPGTDPKVIVDPSNDPAGKKDMVSHETYLKVLGEKKAMAAKLAANEAEKKAAEDRALKEKEDYKSLAEKREAELKDEREKRLKLEERSANALKLRAIVDGAGGTIDREYWDLLPIGMVEMDPETGLPTESSVASAVKLVQTKYAKIITPKNASLPPSDAARGGNVKLDYKTWLNLPDVERIKRRSEVDPSTI